MLDLESRGPGSIPTRGGGNILFFTFCNTNLYNIARSDRIRFKTKNSNVHNTESTGKYKNVAKLQLEWEPPGRQMVSLNISWQTYLIFLNHYLNCYKIKKKNGNEFYLLAFDAFFCPD